MHALIATIAERAIVLALAAGTCDCPMEPSGFAGGSGTPADPYLVCSAQQLQLVGQHLDSSFRLVADIDLGGVPFTPIADGPLIGEDPPTYDGVFDGAGHTVRGLVAGHLKEDIIGLFGRLGVSGIVHDLHMEDVFIQSAICGGGIVGENRGFILRCSVNSGTVHGGYCGGIVGENRGTIEDCCAHATINGAWIAGLVGIQNETLPTLPTIRRSYATGLVAGNQEGGLVSAIVGDSSTVVESSYWDTETSGQTSSAGGLGRTTAQMMQPATYPGWGFGTVWDIEPGVGYPRLLGLADEPDCCPSDLTGSEGAPDGNVDALDFLLLIGQWSSPCAGTCEADITGPTPMLPDGNVDSLDFLLLISQWGSPGCS